MIEAGGAGLDGVFEAGGAGLDGEFEAGRVGLDDTMGSKGESKGSHKAKTKGNGGDLHQAKKGTDQAKNRTKDNAKSKTKTEIEGSHKAETKGNGGDLHQAKMGTGDGGDFEGTSDNLKNYVGTSTRPRPRPPAAT